MRTKLMTLAAENGFSHAAPVDMNALTPRQEVREMCRADRCGQWNANWACPPGCGTLEDDFDYEGMEAIQRRHKRAFADFARQARLLLPDCLPLSAGACTVCRRCTCPDRPCRFPDKRMSSMEAYGLLVGDVCLRSGLSYNYGPRTMTYTSCLLYTEEVK